jgi:hypothetical protein
MHAGLSSSGVALSRIGCNGGVGKGETSNMAGNATPSILHTLCV